jgi:16S rRNA processing protein RimM
MREPDPRALPDHLVVGHLASAHGTRGELLVEPLTDHPGDVFAPGVVLRPADAAGAEPDPDLPPLRVRSVRPFRRGWLVTFAGVEDRNAAEQLRGRYVLIERVRLPALEEGEIFLHELVGLEVARADGTRVGKVVRVYELRPANLIEVRTERGTVLVPFVGSIVREVDVRGGRLVIEPPEGLLD